jgi:transcription initiation factor IIE alpha subunit
MRSFNNGVWTSIEAAEHAEAFKENLKSRIYQYLHSMGEHGATDQEIEDATGIAGNSERPARRALEKERHIKRTKRWRKTRSGCKAIVWVIVSKGGAQ